MSAITLEAADKEGRKGIDDDGERQLHRTTVRSSKQRDTLCLEHTRSYSADMARRGDARKHQGLVQQVCTQQKTSTVVLETQVQWHRDNKWVALSFDPSLFDHVVTVWYESLNSSA